MKQKMALTHLISYVLFLANFSLLAPTSTYANTELDLIVVSDEADSPCSVSNTPPEWSVQSVSLVTSYEIGRTSADRIEDFADSIPGVLTGRNQAGIASNVFIRGFSLNGRLHLNGLRDTQRYYLRDPATIDHIEIIKGLDSVILGSGSPGGAVNTVTKKPNHGKNIRNLTIGVGTPEHYRVSLDIGSDIKQRSDWAWRTIIALQKAETGRKNVNDDRFIIMPSLSWISDKNTLFIEAEHSRQNRDFDFDNVFIDGEFVHDVSYTDPRADSIRTTNRLFVQYLHDFSDSWLTRINASYLKGFRDEKLIGFYYMDATEKNLVGFYRNLQDNHTQYTIRADLEHAKKMGQFEYKSKMGFEIKKEDSTIISAQQIDGFRLNIYNPVFDFELPDDDAISDNSIVLKSEEQAVYFQHSIKNKKILLSLGLRQSHYSSDSLPAGKELRTASNNHLSTSIGAVWEFSPQWKAFVNRTESFLPNGGRDANNNPFKPKLGIQYEMGFRYRKKSFNQKSLAFEGSIYQVDQNNQLKPDPDNPDFRIPFGEVRVKGFELKGDIPLTEKFNMSASYSHYDSEVTKTTDDNQGNRLHSIPKHSASMKLNYAFASTLDLMLIATQVGSREGDNSNSFKLPAYTRFDAGIRWNKSKQRSFNVGVRNLTDKNYVATGGAEDFLVMGRDRTITASFLYNFR